MVLAFLTQKLKSHRKTASLLTSYAKYKCVSVRAASSGIKLPGVSWFTLVK